MKQHPRRLGVLGGTFDPIHCGHLDVATVAKNALGLTRMLIIPSNIPAYRPQPFASSFHRFAMVALAVSGRAGWRASDLELRSNPPSYTTATLTRFHERGYTPAELFFMMGADAFADIETWKNYPQLLDDAHFVVVSRPGCSVGELAGRLPALAPRMRASAAGPDLPPTPVIILIDRMTTNVSSTTIRHRRAAGEPITGLVDIGVQQHIEQHGLYTSSVPGRRGTDNRPDGAAARLHGEG